MQLSKMFRLMLSVALVIGFHEGATAADKSEGKKEGKKAGSRGLQAMIREKKRQARKGKSGAKKPPRPAAKSRPGKKAKPKAAKAAKAPASEEGEEEESPPKGAKVHLNSHIFYLRDGSKLHGALLMRGSRSIAVLTEFGEIEFAPDMVERIVRSDEESSPIPSLTELKEGHLYLGPPEEDEGDEGAVLGENTKEKEALQKKLNLRTGAQAYLPEQGDSKPPTQQPSGEKAETVKPAVKLKPPASEPVKKGKPLSRQEETRKQMEALRAAKAKAAGDEFKPKPKAPAAKKDIADLLKGISNDKADELLKSLKKAGSK